MRSIFASRLQIQAVKTSIPLAQSGEQGSDAKITPLLALVWGSAAPAPILELSVTEPLTDRTTLCVHHEQGGPISLHENDHRQF